MTKIIFGLLIITSLFISPIVNNAVGETGPDRESIYGKQVKKPVSNEKPIFLTKFLSPESFKSTQQSEITGFSDLLISESVSPATFRQRSSTVASLTDGRTVVGWTDDRNGNKMIFIQIFDSDGVRSDSNILAIGREDQNNLSNPKLISDGSGGFYLGWRDDATGSLYVVRFNGDLTRDTEFRISNPALGYAGLYDLASYPGGKLAAVWEQFSIKSSINFRIFSSAGAPLTENITINTDDGTATYRAPSIAVEPSGNSAVTWEDYRNGDADIYMQFVNSDGSLYGANRRIIDFDYLTYEQYLPEIVYSVTDGYIISWLDKRSGTQRVFLQRVTRADGQIGANVNISNNAVNFTDWYISMAVNSSGNLAVAWASVDGIDKILLQKFSAGMIPDDTIITVSEFPTGSKWETALEFDNADNLYCIWSDSRRGNWDIMTMQYGSDRSPLFEDDMIVNDDAQGAHSTQPVVASTYPTPNCLVAYSDARNDAGDIYIRFTLSNGQFYDDELKLNSDVIPTQQKDPFIIMNYNFDSIGEMIITWIDERAINGIVGQRVFATKLSEPYNYLPYTEFMVSDTYNLSPKSSPRFANSEYGSDAYAWIDYASGEGHIYSRIWNYESNPSYLTDIKQISQAGIETNNDFLNLMAFFNGNPDDERYTLAWLSGGIENGPSVIFAQCDLTNTVVNRFSFTSDQSDIDIKEIAAVGNLAGDMYLLWSGQGNGVCNLYLTVFDRFGNIKNPTIEIAEGFGFVKDGLDIAVDINHKVVCVTWVDGRNGRDEVFYQLFYPDMTLYGPNMPASETESRYMMSPTVTINNLNALIAWVDPRANGHNVYMTQIDLGTTDIDDDPTALPSEFELRQNYPNPFNPTTSIQFVLPTKSQVKLEVYNLLGRKIATISDKMFEAGTHTVNWDGTNSSGGQVASGIYFYRIETGNFEQTRKMILLK